MTHNIFDRVVMYALRKYELGMSIWQIQSIKKNTKKKQEYFKPCFLPQSFYFPHFPKDIVICYAKLKEDEGNALVVCCNYRVKNFRSPLNHLLLKKYRSTKKWFT